MACESLVPLDLYIPLASGLQARDKGGEIVLLAHPCACMGGTTWETAKECKPRCVVKVRGPL